MTTTQDAARPILDGLGDRCPDVAAAFDRCDWSEVAQALRDAGLDTTWDQVRAAVLDADPTADA